MLINPVKVLLALAVMNNGMNSKRLAYPSFLFNTLTVAIYLTLTGFVNCVTQLVKYLWWNGSTWIWVIDSACNSASKVPYGETGLLGFESSIQHVCLYFSWFILELNQRNSWEVAWGVSQEYGCVLITSSPRQSAWFYLGLSSSISRRSFQAVLFRHKFRLIGVWM